MSDQLYGCSTEGPVTAEQAREALLECFVEAHAEALGVDDAQPAEVRSLIVTTLKKAFADVGADYDNPNKESIIQAMERLKVFAQAFRSPEIIEKHYTQMMEIVNRIEE